MAGRDNRLSAFVGNLPPFVIQGHFDHIFAGCKLSSVRMIRDRETDEFKGCAFVDFEDEESLQTALRTNGSVVEGYQIRVNHAMDRRGGGPRGGSRGGAGNGYGGRGGPRGGGGYDGRGGGFRGGGSGGQEGWSFRGRPSAGGGRYAGGPRGGMGGRGGPDHRPSYHPPGIPRDSIQRTGRSFTFDQTPEVNSNSSDDRPRLKLKPRTVPLDSTDNRQLTERDKAIFGTGRPREASPSLEAPEESDAQTTS